MDYRRNRMMNSSSHRNQHRNHRDHHHHVHTLKTFFLFMKRSERIAWIIVFIQFIIILSNRASWSSISSSLSSSSILRGKITTQNQNTIIMTNTDPSSLLMNDHTFQHYNNKNIKNNSNNNYNKNNNSQNIPFYDQPTIHPEKAGLVSRVWHSNSSPNINPNLQSGSCWCGADNWCMCTAAIAIDCILTSGEQHFWLVKRKDTGQYATMGGFVEVGESTAETIVREMKEEMNVDIPLNKAKLFGVYSDPKRDGRRHTVSAVYVLDIPEETYTQAGDDAAKVVKVHIDDIPNLDFFADHKTLLSDYIAQRNGSRTLSKDDSIQRDVCNMD